MKKALVQKTITYAWLVGLAVLSGITMSYAYSTWANPSTDWNTVTRSSLVNGASTDQYIMSGSLTVKNTAANANGVVVSAGNVGVGVAADTTYKLKTNGSVTAAKYCDATTPTSCIDTSVAGSNLSVANDNLPPNTVLPFRSGTCPAGWTAYTTLDGYYPRGITAGAYWIETQYTYTCQQSYVTAEPQTTGNPSLDNYYCTTYGMTAYCPLPAYAVNTAVYCQSRASACNTTRTATTNTNYGTAGNTNFLMCYGYKPNAYKTDCVDRTSGGLSMTAVACPLSNTTQIYHYYNGSTGGAASHTHTPNQQSFINMAGSSAIYTWPVLSTESNYPATVTMLFCKKN